MYYLCTMKNENDMEMILKRNGFIPTENPNEYVRGTWTIRLENNKIEVFNSSEDVKPVYLFEDIRKIDIYQLFEEINYVSF